MVKNNKTFYIFNAGCIRRGIDCIDIKIFLKKNGWRMVSSPRHALLNIISTCGVVFENERTSLNAIKKVVALNPGSRIIITGCLPYINQDAIDGIGQFEFLSPQKLSSIESLIECHYSFSDAKKMSPHEDNFPILHYLIARSFCRRSSFYKFLFKKYCMNNNFITLSIRANQYITKVKSFFNLKTSSITPYYNIKISDGCLSACTFCATRFATGRLKSRDPSEIIRDFEIGIKRGFKVVQLIGEDTGAYGIDIGSNLADLLIEIFSIKKDFKLSIIDFNPKWLILHQEKLLPIILRYQKKIQDLFIPIQSGSNFILNRMKRGYSSVELIKILRKISNKAPDIGLRTSVMVGFPGESDDDFMKTVDLIKKMKFKETTVNRYEDRPNTPSSDFDNKIAQNIIEYRAKYLKQKLGCYILS
ncbi:tRNA (N(6)-L-threonylcarbamoyladenosine(37)-C(2))-methylthiotran sferase [Desulfothermus okinawensis JCM 13304]